MEKKITVIGTDSTHCVAFARLLNEEITSPWRISYALRDNRTHLALSQDRFQGIEAQMTELGMTIFDDLTPELVSSTDAFIIASVDASLHVSQFAELVTFGKPIFIDKPIAYSSCSMTEIFTLANAHQLDLMSSSSLRFSAAILTVKSQLKELDQPITKITLNGPMPLEAEIPGMFWYGIHLIETLLTICPKEFTVDSVKETTDRLVIHCQSGDIDVVFCGDLSGRGSFSGKVETTGQTINFDQETDTRPLYAYLVDAMLGYFETGISPVTQAQTHSVISLVERINDKGGWH